MEGAEEGEEEVWEREGERKWRGEEVEEEEKEAEGKED
jgi:hypothetical protein